MDFNALSVPPCAAHILGTDDMGRDLLAMLLHGGRVSLLIGLLAASIAAITAILYGGLAGLGPRWLEGLLMRLAELLMSVPAILYTVTVLAIFGAPGALSLAVVIGATSWMPVAKLIRAEVRQLHRSEYILAARLSGAKFPYLLLRHLLPNMLPTVSFALIHNISHAIAAEATLSFLGLGMPPGSATWGALMSLSREALFTGSWWVVLIPSLFLIATLVAIANIADYCRRNNR